MSKQQFKLLSEKQSENLAQIIQNFFVKSAQVILGARTTPPPPTEVPSPHHHTNQWFNIELEDSGLLSPEDLALWKTRDILLMPPLVVETVLDLRGLEPNQTLVVDDGTIVKTEKKSEIVLERWLVEFDLNTFDNDSVELPGIYKKLIILFRSLYMLVRLLPAYRLQNSLMESRQAPCNVSVRAKVIDGTRPIISKGRIGLSKALSEPKTRSKGGHLTSRMLEPILTPIGALKVSTSYRVDCNFELRDNEELISNQFMLDTEEDVAPHPARPASYENNSPTAHSQSTSSAESRILFRTSVQSSSGQSPRRRSSTRSVPLFKVGSIASSSSPPPQQQQQQQLSVGSPGPFSQAILNSSAATNNASGSSFVTSKPIPVTLNRTSSNVSVIVRQPRDSLTRSVSSFNNSFANGGSADSTSLHGRKQHEAEATGAAGAPASVQMYPTLSSTSSKFPSSFGSRFRTSVGSRQNSLDSQLGPTNNPALQNFKKRGSRPISGSDVGPTNSMYLDDDLDSFVKMLDSRPDLRLSSGNTITGTVGAPQASTIYDDTLRSFKQFQRTNDLFSGNSSEQRPVTSLPIRRGSSDRLNRSVSPGSSNAMVAAPRSIPLVVQSSVASRRRSSASSYSPSLPYVKLGQTTAGPAGPALTPVVSYANKFSASPSVESSVIGMLRRRSSAASSHSHISGRAVQNMATSAGAAARTAGGDASNHGSPQASPRMQLGSFSNHSSRNVSHHDLIDSRGSRGSTTSQDCSVPASPNLMNPELMKLRSYNEQVFESDEEGDEEGDVNDQDNDGNAQSGAHNDNSLESRRSTSAGQRNATARPFTPHYPANLHQLAMYRRQGSVESGHVRHSNSNEDDEDELLFAMSDMTLAKNNVDF
ncbi:DEKNAAC103025 [Brettanomyces naardenensis]|uniref:Autophagy-related protein 13 n=1 Tax=Brettanomyces naardenensis TaxID=13370 RepID=A0A448YMD7_BRENA|nr:DEKNAAC103025 [Brettanomyces naardenensis]